MSHPPLHKVLPRYGDARKFAQQRIDLQGQIAVTDLPRLRDIVAGEAGQVDVGLSFGRDEEGRKVLNGTLLASVPLTCQRCLEPVAVNLSCDIHLGIVWDEDQAKSLPRTLDPWIVEEGVTDFYDIVEEELLLALPAVAYHSEMCIPGELFSRGDAVPSEKASGQNPFQVLEQLKGSPKK